MAPAPKNNNPLKYRVVLLEWYNAPSRPRERQSLDDRLPHTYHAYNSHAHQDDADIFQRCAMQVDAF